MKNGVANLGALPLTQALAAARGLRVDLISEGGPDFDLLWPIYQTGPVQYRALTTGKVVSLPQALPRTAQVCRSKSVVNKGVTRLAGRKLSLVHGEGTPRR